VVAGTFVRVALPAGEGIEAHVAEICDRESALSLEYWQRKSLEVVLLAEDVPPEFDLVYDPAQHIGCKGTTFLSLIARMAQKF